MKSIVTAATLLLLPLFSAFAFDTQFSFSVSTDFTTPLPYAKRAGELLQADLKGDAEFYLYANDKTTFFANGQLVLDMLRSQSDSFDLGPAGTFVGVTLKEAWLDYTSDCWAARVGRQICSWGKADVISVTNVLCPRNYSSFNIFTMTDSLLGIDAARFSLKYDVYSLDFYWVPIVRASAIPTDPNHFVQKTLSESTELGFIQLGKIKTPDPKFENFEYGLKASAYWKYADVSLYAFYGWDKFPGSFKLDMVKLTSDLRRMTMFGADASIPLGAVVLRLEGAFFPYSAMPIIPQSLEMEEYVRNGFSLEFGYKERNRLKMLAGLDWMPGGWILSAQYYGDLAFGDMEELNRKNYMHFATLVVSKSFFKDILTLSLASLVQLEEWNNAFVLNAAVKASDSLSFSAALYCVNLFEDFKQDTLNEFRNWGGATIGAKYSF